jgi:two-component system, OmpR family, response regulator AdeR
MDNALVLIAEDEPEISEILTAYFSREGFRTVTASNGAIAVQHHAMLSPDLVILDVRMPKKTGLEVLAEIRRTSDTPVIMVTALGEDLDKLTALGMGADDYVLKPFNVLEVVARARAVLRRSRSRAQGQKTIRLGGIEIDPESHIVSVIDSTGGRKVLDLTLTEFRIIVHMAGAPKRVYSRSDIIDACLPSDGEALERTVDSHMSKLRRKLCDHGITDYLEGVRGVGYRLVPAI